MKHKQQKKNKTHKRVKYFKKLSSKNELTKTRKKCLTDNEVSKLCASGQYSGYIENFYNKENLQKFNNKTEVLSKIKKYKKYSAAYDKYTHSLMDKFSPHSNRGKDLKMIKNDFYSYINDQWFKETKIDQRPKYYVEVDNFRIIQEKVYYELIDYVEKYIKENPNSKKAQNIKDLYDSLTTKSTKNLQKHCLQILDEVNDYFNPNTKSNLYDLLVDLNQNEIISWGAPIQWAMLPDEKNVKKYISHLSPAQLSIYDYLIYIDDPSDDAETKKYKAYIKKHFFTYIEQIFDVCLGKGHGYKAQDVWDVEVALLDAMSCDSVKLPREDPNYYNVVSANDLDDVYGLNWTEFSGKLGFSEMPKKVIVSSLDALKCTMELLKEQWDSPKWKTYWLYIHYRQIIRFFVGVRHIHFEFHSKILRGQPVMMPNEIYPIFGLSMCFNTFLTEQYVSHNYNPLYVNYVKHLADDLRTLFIRKIRRNTWLSPETKKTALRKLEKLELVVGSPDKLRYDPIFDYKPDDPWYNMRLLTKWKFKKNLTLEGQDVVDIPEIDWNEFKLVGTQAYMVNAYYRPTSNSIYVPLAYLQPPFIDLKERGLEYNLVYIGYTIGHELSHSLDDNGSKFDEEGNLNNWWTDDDRRHFEAKIKDVVKQYEEFAKRDGITFDAEIGVGEDLADISGMSLIEEYLMDNQIIDNDLDIIKRIQLEMLYAYLAIQGNQKIYKKALKAQLKINPHPLEKYRVNCPLSRLELFRTIFDIKKGDGMWWHNTDTIW